MKLKQSLLTAILIIGGLTNLNAQVTQFPFEFNGTQMFIKVQTNKSDSLHFIFDSGTTGASIDSATLEKAGLNREYRSIASIAGSGGSRFYTLALNQNLKIKDAELKNINLAMVDFKTLSAVTGARIDGIIGYELLNKYVTQIDFDHKRMLLYDQINAVDTTGYTGIPFEFSKGIMIPRFPISVTLANGETFTGKVMFDTGNAFSLIVSTPFSKFHSFNGKLGETGFTSGQGMNAVTKDQLANIKSMSFNGFNFGQMGFRLTVNDQAEAKDGYLGILGIEIIKRFNVILDYAHKKIYLKPNNAYHSPLSQMVLPGQSNAESKAFLEKNKTKPGVMVTSSGLQYKILKKGNGPKPKPEDRVSLQYTIRTIDGQKLWSTYDDKTPWVHHLDKALAGVREGVLMMPAGSKWILYIPSSLAFGDQGYESLGPGTAIIYEVELLKE